MPVLVLGIVAILVAVGLFFLSKQVGGAEQHGSARLERRVKELHSYEVPEVLAISPASGSRPYLQWLMESTAAEARRTTPRTICLRSWAAISSDVLGARTSRPTWPAWPLGNRKWFMAVHSP